MRIYEVQNTEGQRVWKGVLQELMDANEETFTLFMVERARRLEPGDFIRVQTDQESWKLTRLDPVP